MVLSVVFACAAQAAIQLEAEKASTKEVVLSWSGTSGMCALERKSGPGGWEKVAAVSSGSAVDSGIAAYGTYSYRVKAGTAISNEVTVGPPPAGFHTMAAKPEQPHQDGAFGRLMSLALDASGDPAAVFVHMDPNGDGNGSDSALVFVSWDRAAYRWNAPVTVAVVGNYDPRPPVVGISLAHDAATDVFGVVWCDTDNHGVNLALSTDGGMSWKSGKAYTEGRSMGGASLQLAGGKAYLVLAQDSKNTLRWMTGGEAEQPSQWKVSFAPLPEGTNGVLRGSALALDGAGEPAVAYWVRPGKGNVWTLEFWRPGSGKLTQVTDSGTSGYQPDGVLLAFAGSQPRVVIDSRIDRAVAVSHYSLYSNDGGTTWSKPVAVPDDGNEHLAGFLSLAAAADGRVALAADVIGGNTQNMRCNWPKVSRTTDLASWTTCSPLGGPESGLRTNWGSVAFAPSGMLYLAFQARQTAPKQALPAGVMIWGGR